MITYRAIVIILKGMLPIAIVILTTVCSYADLAEVSPVPDGNNIALGAPF